MIHTVKGFGVVNKAEVDLCVCVCVELSSFFNDLSDVGNLISGSSAFSKSNLNIRNFVGHVLLKPRLVKFEHYLTSVFCSVQFSRSVMSNSLRPHESQHARSPCPSLTLEVYSKLMSIKSVMLSSHLILCWTLLLLPWILPASGSFPVSQLFTC